MIVPKCPLCGSFIEADYFLEGVREQLRCAQCKTLLFPVQNTLSENFEYAVAQENKWHVIEY